MNKVGLIRAVSMKTGLAQKQCEQIITAALDAITAELSAGGTVKIVGFGVFEMKLRKARIGRNPKTKEPMEIPACNSPVFRPGRALKEAVTVVKL